MPEPELEREPDLRAIPEGPLPETFCTACRQVGGVVIEHRLEYLDPPEGGWPPGVAAARLALACRACGSDFLSRTTRLVANLGASLAGVMPKVSARERPWLKCEACQREAAARVWPWARCTRCGRESRGKFE
ncbi:hypothetical protein [Streptomyces longwoodensis]|uniref:hypothetical protein n=1 Tax=Streptomyces longwoodensis TaxID=68231 RepID=UPI0036F4C4F9